MFVQRRAAEEGHELIDLDDATAIDVQPCTQRVDLLIAHRSGWDPEASAESRLHLPWLEAAGAILGISISY